MNLTVDIGNTAVKWATFEGRTLVESGVWGAESGKRRVENIMVCASGDDGKLEALRDYFNQQGSPFSVLRSPFEHLPIRLDYKTPATLGADRVADACGAWSLHRGEPCLIIDAGTCITVDFLDGEGTYHGGAIMPGLGMSLRALNTFTARLPLVSLEGVERAPVLGRSTEESILAGTLGATLLALAGYVALYREKAPALHVIVTGGDAERLMASGTNQWEHVPHLAMTGMNEILMNGEWGRKVIKEKK